LLWIFVIDNDVTKAISPTALDAAIQAVERGLCADGPDARGFDEGNRAGREWRALEAWDVEGNFLLNSEIDPERIGGREHDVSFMEGTKKWRKFTKWNSAGYTVDLETGQPNFLPATPLQYLLRLGLQNAVFGDPITLFGLQQRERRLRIVTEQPDIVGEAPTFEEMDHYLRESEDFARLDIPAMG